MSRNINDNSIKLFVSNRNLRITNIHFRFSVGDKYANDNGQHTYYLTNQEFFAIDNPFAGARVPSVINGFIDWNSMT
ncbi:hypothetical protein [Peijinzhouia sedimentorum]